MFHSGHCFFLSFPQILKTHYMKQSTQLFTRLTFLYVTVCAQTIIYIQCVSCFLSWLQSVCYMFFCCTPYLFCTNFHFQNFLSYIQEYYFSMVMCIQPLANFSFLRIYSISCSSLALINYLSTKNTVVRQSSSLFISIRATFLSNFKMLLRYTKRHKNSFLTVTYLNFFTSKYSRLHLILLSNRWFP